MHPFEKSGHSYEHSKLVNLEIIPVARVFVLEFTMKAGRAILSPASIFYVSASLVSVRRSYYTGPPCHGDLEIMTTIWNRTCNAISTGTHLSLAGVGSVMPIAHQGFDVLS